MRKKIFIFARHHQEASFCAEALGYAQGEWNYVTSESVRGYTEETVILYGRYYLHPNSADIINQLTAQHMQFFQVTSLRPE